MNEKLLPLLGIARKAGKLALGNDPAVDALRKGKSRLVLLACDLSQRTANGIRSAATEEGIDLVELDATMDQIAMALGKRTGIISVNDVGFSKKIVALCTAANDEREGI